MLEKRTSSRRRTLLNGRIEADKLKGWAVACSVRNLGDGGARVALSTATLVPDSFLLGVSEAEPRAARLVWYGDGQAGLALAERRTREGDRSAAVDPQRPALPLGTAVEARIRAVVSRPTRRRFTPL